MAHLSCQRRLPQASTRWCQGEKVLLHPRLPAQRSSQRNSQLSVATRVVQGDNDGSSSNDTGSVMRRLQQALGMCCTAAALVASAALLTPALQPPAATAMTVASTGSSSVSEAAAHGLRYGSGSSTAGRQYSSQEEEVYEVASETEDKLILAVRQMESRMDNAFGSVANNLPFAPGGSKEDVARVTKDAKTLITEVWEVVDQNYLDARNTGFDRDRWRELRDEALSRRYTSMDAVYRTVRDMMARGLSDPYCRFITPSELNGMKKYDVTGVGLNLGTPQEYTKKTGKPLPIDRRETTQGTFVVGLSRGSAADKAGILQGDEILEIDGEPANTLTPFQVASRIQGEASPSIEPAASSEPTMIQLKVRHSESYETQVVSMQRPPRPTTPSPVSSRLSQPWGSKEGPVGYITLSSFNARAQRDLAEAVKQLEAGGAQRLVLDLRDNRGGLVSEGLEVARLFLEGNAPIVITESRAMSDSPVAAGPALTRLPLLVLVNDHTASASEILSGALKDNCRAALAGGRTYGKGLIQSVYEMSDGSGMVVTVGKYLTPNRVDIDQFGIEPNFSSEPSAQQLDEAIKACRLNKEGAGQPGGLLQQV